MQTRILAAAMAACGVLFALALARRDSHDASEPVAVVAARTETPRAAPSTATRSAAEPGAAAAGPVSEQAAHDDAERAKLDFVQERIIRYLRWGRIAPEDEARVRAVLIELGEDLIADVAGALDAVSSRDIDDEREARTLVEKLDVLSYLAVSSAPSARDAIARLATREVDWTEGGKLRDRAAAAVTFEAFDTLARIDPDAAAAHAARQPERRRRAYVVHYVYGRRLAGKTEEEIARDIAHRFGPRWAALVAE